METLADLRQKRGLRLEDVAKGSGVPISTVSRIERGQVPRNRERVQAMASFYGLPISEFYAAVVAAGFKESAGQRLSGVN